MPDVAAWQWAVGAVCAFFIGVSKTGVPGLAILVVPLMVLMVGDARQAAGWLLPILIVADIFAVGYWRRHASIKVLLRLVPWVLAGLAAGAWALSLSETILRPLIGCIVLAMLGIYVLRRLRPNTAGVPSHGAPYGVLAGFSTTVANAAAPVMNLYLLSMNMSKEVFIGTTAWFFFCINLTKVPVYVFHQMLTPKSLLFDAWLIPAIVAGSLAGKWLFHLIPQKIFEAIVIFFTVVATLALFR